MINSEEGQFESEITESEDSKEEDSKEVRFIDIDQSSIDIISDFHKLLARIRVEPEDREEIEHLEKKIKNHYFLQFHYEFLLREPLANYSTEEKRILLQKNWEAIKHNYVNRSELIKNNLNSNLEELNDNTINELFDEYRRLNPKLFIEQENRDIETYYSIICGQDYLDLFYSLEPIFEDYVDILDKYSLSMGGVFPVLMEDKLKERKRGRGVNRGIYSYEAERSSGYLFVKLTPKLGAIYNPDYSLNTIFKLDPELETEIIKERQRNGLINLGLINSLLSDLEKYKVNKKNKKFLSQYIQFRSLLPKSLVDSFEKKFSINIPDKLRKKIYESTGKFEELFRNDIEKIILNHEDKIDDIAKDLSVRLNELKERKIEFIRAKRSGWLIDRGDLFCILDDLHRTLKAENLNDINPYFSVVSSYLYFRQFFPPNLNKKLENRFKIKIPPEFNNILTYQDFLDIPYKQLSNFLKQNEKEFKSLAFFFNL